MTTPASNDADKPTTNTGSGTSKATDSTDNKTKNAAKETGGTVTVRLLAQSWLCPFEDDNGKITYVAYNQGDELEVSEDVFVNLTGPDVFKPAFARVDESAATS